MIKEVVRGMDSWQCSDAEKISIFLRIVGIGAVWIKDTHAAKKGLVCDLHTVQVVDVTICRPSGEVSLGMNVTDFVAVSFPAF